MGKREKLQSLMGQRVKVMVEIEEWMELLHACRSAKRIVEVSDIKIILFDLQHKKNELDVQIAEASKDKRIYGRSVGK